MGRSLTRIFLAVPIWQFAFGVIGPASADLHFLARAMAFIPSVLATWALFRFVDDVYGLKERSRGD